MTSVLSRLKAVSIWGPAGVDPRDNRVKFQLRVGYPIYDGLLFFFGIFASLGGTPALRQTFGADYAQLWGFSLAGAALAAFFGIAFPAKNWRVELYAKWFIFFMIVIYALAIMYAAFFDVRVVDRPDWGRFGTGFGILATAIPPLIRIPDIARDKEIHGWT